MDSRSIRRAALAALAALGMLSAPRVAFAHPAPFSYVDLRIEAAVIHVSVVAHVFDLGHDLDVSPPEQLLEASVLAQKAGAIESLVAGRLHLTADGRELRGVHAGVAEALPERQSIRVRLDYQTDRTTGLLAVRTVMFPYDGMHQTFLNVYDRDALASQAILDAADTELVYFSNTVRGAVAAAARFFTRGIAAVLLAPECWLLVFGLLLLGGSTRRLLLLVTALTLGDAVGVALAYSRVLMPPERTLEPALALSLVYLGIDNLLVSGGRDVRAAIAVWFGLVYGFIVVGTLRAVVLSTGALAASFVSFHAGMELAEALLVLALGWLFSVLRARNDLARRQLVTAGSAVLILAGALWFVTRVFFSGGLS